MKNLVNIHPYDRIVRMLLGVLFLLFGFFWQGGSSMIILITIGFLLLVTGIVGYCPLYSLLKFNTKGKCVKIPTWQWIFSIILVAIFAIGGSIASIFFSKKFFLEDYNVMNNYYKQTLFNTGKDKRAESIENYTHLVEEYTKFFQKYTIYKPYSLRSDTQLDANLREIATMIANERDAIMTGNLPTSHLAFEKIRPIFQDILKRNNFSLLAVALVDFHDVMEIVIDAADKKDPAGVIQAYGVADEKLKAIEVEANDSEIQSIRKSLDEVRILADQGKSQELAPKAQELKTNFVKVYLKRG